MVRCNCLPPGISGAINVSEADSSAVTIFRSARPSTIDIFELTGPRAPFFAHNRADTIDKVGEYRGRPAIDADAERRGAEGNVIAESEREVVAPPDRGRHGIKPRFAP